MTSSALVENREHDVVASGIGVERHRRRLVAHVWDRLARPTIRRPESKCGSDGGELGTVGCQQSRRFGFRTRSRRCDSSGRWCRGWRSILSAAFQALPSHTASQTSSLSVSTAKPMRSLLGSAASVVHCDFAGRSGRSGERSFAAPTGAVPGAIVDLGLVLGVDDHRVAAELLVGHADVGVILSARFRPKRLDYPNCDPFHTSANSSLLVSLMISDHLVRVGTGGQTHLAWLRHRCRP